MAGAASLERVCGILAGGYCLEAIWESTGYREALALSALSPAMLHHVRTCEGLNVALFPPLGGSAGFNAYGPEIDHGSLDVLGTAYCATQWK